MWLQISSGFSRTDNLSLIMAMNNFTPFLASYNELVQQWQERLRILKGMEEKAVEFPELMRMIWVFKQSCVEFQSFQVCLRGHSSDRTAILIFLRSSWIILAQNLHLVISLITGNN